MQKTHTITGQEAIELIRNEVKRMGDHWRYKDHYDVCSYNPANRDRVDQNYEGRLGAPTGDHCIVGGVIEKGLDIRMFDAEGFGIAGSWDERRVRDTEWAAEAQRKPVRFTKAANMILRMAQVVQDAGGTHGAALAAASELWDMLKRGQLVIPGEEVE